MFKNYLTSDDWELVETEVKLNLKFQYQKSLANFGQLSTFDCKQQKNIKFSLKIIWKNAIACDKMIH